MIKIVKCHFKIVFYEESQQTNSDKRHLSWKNVIQVAYGRSTNQIQRKEKSCKAILLRKGEVTFLLRVQIDKTIYPLWGKYYLKIHTQIAQYL